VAVLAMLPAAVIPPLSALAGQDYPVERALTFSILWFACGTVIFALSFFFSVLLRGEYTAAIACYLALSLNGRLSNWHAPRPSHLNLFRTMGAPPDIPVLSGAFPWMDVGLMLLIAIALFAAGTKITQRQSL
jgi:ABC-2 type transport system permease protein